MVHTLLRSTYVYLGLVQYFTATQARPGASQRCLCLVRSALGSTNQSSILANNEHRYGQTRSSSPALLALVAVDFQLRRIEFNELHGRVMCQSRRSKSHTAV